MEGHKDEYDEMLLEGSKVANLGEVFLYLLLLAR
jgi:hypothetical protein